MELIALSGYARVGKDEAAKVLVEEHGFTRVAFADKLRETLYALNPIVGHYYYEKNPDLLTVQDIIDKYGWDGYKETEYKDEIRRLLQRMGTEVGRELLGENIWVDSTFNGLPDDSKIVVTDCRFPNEAQAIKSRGGQVWRIERSGVGPINDHPSETGLDNWKFDRYVWNNGTLEDYYEMLRGVKV